MVNHMPNPTKTASGVYYFVRRVPSDLVDVVGKGRGNSSRRASYGVW
jgi:hypothetical protein